MSVLILPNRINFENKPTNSFSVPSGIHNKLRQVPNDGVFKVPLPRRPQAVMVNLPLKNTMISK